jgi:hypothetical protein
VVTVLMKGALILFVTAALVGCLGGARSTARAAEKETAT